MASRTFVSRFSPNRTDPAVLEAIFVQRDKLAEVWLERLRDSVLTGVKHHLLAIGPRGCGKSHLVALLICRLRQDPAVTERVRIAWLPEDETALSFWKFLLRILRALNAEYGDEFPPPPREELADATDDHRSAGLADYLLKKLNGRTLLVVVEALDEVMRLLKDEGQKRWRAFLQEHPVAATLATAQQLTPDVSDHDRPFFNFFQIEHLQPLSADEALLLLRKIAEHSNNAPLVEFLQTTTGRARVRAIRHITGGSHRVFIILSEFATRENLDGLVTAFEELLDELTPYYQERLRWLPDQQREIVEFLCRQARTVPVKEIAGELFLTEQTAAAQLKHLKDKGYVTAEASGRESRYELAEPLMRLCVEVKRPRREPIRLIVEFLRVWYDPERFASLCEKFQQDDDLERYIEAVIRGFEREDMSAIEAALLHDLESAQQSSDKEQLARIAEEMVDNPHSGVCAAGGLALLTLGREAEALRTFERVGSRPPGNILARIGRLIILWTHGSSVRAMQEMVQIVEQTIQLYPGPKCEALRITTGQFLEQSGWHEEALEAFDQATKLNENSFSAWNNKAFVLNALGRHAEALIAGERAIQLDSTSAYPRYNVGRAKLGLGRVQEALDDLRLAIELNGNLSNAFEALAEAHTIAGDWDEAERVLTQRFQLPAGSHNFARAWHLPDIILAIFRASADSRVWRFRTNRLADISAEEKARRAPGDPRPNPFAQLGNALIQSLTSKAYSEATADALDVWAEVWRGVSERHQDLSLSTRIFGVGLQYVRTKDERVLLDLVREERSILRNLFRFTDGTDEG
jgi:tetratricopeptide (TPR) repeat protein